MSGEGKQLKEDTTWVPRPWGMFKGQHEDQLAWSRESGNREETRRFCP